MKLATPHRPDRWAAAAVSASLLALSVYVYVHRYVEKYGLIGDRFWRALFWDARVYDYGGQYVFQNENPYAAPVYHIPFDLPFISPPAVAYVFGILSGVLGKALLPLLAASHVVSLVASPLILTRLTLGRSRTDLALGYALFVCGLGAWGVTTIVAGNFGSTLYLLIFAGLARGVRKDRWRLFHIAVVLAAQFKPPYALLWIVPLLANGWSWRQARQIAIAGAIAALRYAIADLADKSYFSQWLGALTRQVQRGDVGFSAYGAMFSIVWPDVTSSAPALMQALVCAPLALFLLFDKTRGPLRIAALITFAILANPRMKEYDMAFASIPVGALYLAAFAPEPASPGRKALALAGVALVTLALLKGDHLPLIGPFIYAIAMAGAIVTLAAPRLLARARA